ncbi:MAG: ComEC/Rec2 family competence protein [Elusimicrobia bacterium]|nr:ComEC/Rec2 family competence protein [Elusimicrobiota bacterium]
MADFPKQRYSRLEFLLRAEKLNDAKVEGNVLVRVDSSHESSIFWRDHIAVVGHLADSRSKYLNRQRIYSVLWADSWEPVEVQESTFSWIMRRVNSIRSRMLMTFSGAFSKESAAILCGIVLGEKTAISWELNKAFRDSGAMHLLVASGSNVTFVMGLVYWGTYLLRLRRAHAAVAGLFVAGLYTLCAGADAPLLRAYGMTVAACAGYLLDRNSGIFQGLLIAFGMLVAMDPQSLFQVGFQMSFVATLSLVLTFSHWSIPAGWPKPVRYLGMVFLASVVAQTALFPILANTFNRISLVAIFSNVVLVPLTGILMGLGFLVFLLSFLSWGFLFAGGVWVTGIFLGCMEAAVKFFAGMRWSSIGVPPMGLGWALAYYGGVASLWVFPSPALRKGFLVWGAVSSCIAFALVLI